MRLTVRVPATVANLGPGFDCFGLAVDLCNEVTINTEAESGVSWEGEGAEELPTDGSDMVSRAIRHVAELAVETRRHALPPFHLHGLNRIPLERGLGSSAAAAVAGVVLAYRILDLGDPPAQTTFSIAAEIEGHPDNAAAAIFGGFTIAMADGLVRRLDPHPDLRPALLVPLDVRLPTAEARRALGDSFSREDMVFNASHAALTVVAVTHDPGLLFPALRDRIHQEVRLALVREVRDTFERLAQAGIPVCVAGAGPSLLAFDSKGSTVPDPGPGWRVLRVPLHAGGAAIVTV